MRTFLSIACLLFLVGCNKEASVQLPQTKVQMAEEMPTRYDSSAMAKLHIPKNCKIVGMNNFHKIIENSSGTQFVVETEMLQTPYIVVRDLPDLW